MSEWYTKNISGYQIIKLKYEQFLFNVLPTTLLSDHTPNNETRTTFTSKKRGSLLILIKTPHSYVYESDEQVRQIVCSVGAVFVGALGRTIYFWDFYSSDDYPLYKIVFDEEINVVGYGSWFIVKTKSGHVYMSDGSVYFVENLRKENNLPFDSSTTEEKILDIVCGYDHNLILTDKGKVYGYGRSGVNYNRSRKWFTLDISNIPDKIKRIYCTTNRSFLLTESGHLYVSSGSDDIGVINMMAFSFVWTLIPDLQNEIVTNISTVPSRIQRSLVNCKYLNNYFMNSPNKEYHRYKYMSATTLSKINSIFAKYFFENHLKTYAFFTPLYSRRDCTGMYFIIVSTKSQRIYFVNYFNFNQFGLSLNNIEINKPRLHYSFNNDIKEIVCGGNSSLILKKDNSLYIDENSYGSKLNEFEWNKIFPEFDKATSILKCGITTSDNLVLAINQDNITKHFNFKCAWKVADIIFN